MDLHFITNPEMAPRARDDVRILELGITPYEDNRRVKVEIGITPFAPTDRPSLEIVARNALGANVGSFTVVETVQPNLGLTLHLRDPEPVGEYTISADLYYEPDRVQHSVSVSLTIPQAAP